MLRFLGAVAIFVAALVVSAPPSNAQLSVTPSGDCVFRGPSGGPFTRNNCDFTLTNTTSSALVVKSWLSVNFEPVWMAATVDGAPITGTFSNQTTLNLPANGTMAIALSPRSTSPAPGDGSIGTINFRANGFSQEVNAVARIALVASNDNFAAATAYPAPAVFSTSFSNVGATKEPGEPNHAGNAGGHSLWYRYTPPANGTASIKFEYTNFNSLIAVYTGSSVSTLTPVVSGAGATASVSFPVTAGTNYHIAVDGANGATGFGQITITETLTIPNDAFADAVEFPPDGGAAQQFVRQTTQPTRQTNEPPHGGGFGSSVWYRWTAPRNAVYRFQTSVSSITPPIVAVYTGETLPTLTEIASTANLAGRLNYVDFTAVEGTTYHMAVAGFEFSTYTVSLQLAPQKPLGLFSAILPASRAGVPGQLLGVFANIANTTNQTGTNCRPVAPNIFLSTTPMGFNYQTTSPDNALVGTPNTPVSIPPGGVQNFVLQVQRTEMVDAGVLGFRFTCDNLADAPFYPEANGWILRRTYPRPADVIAIGATLPGPPPGVVDVTAGTSVFAVAGVNIGESATVFAVPRATRPGGVALSVCETDDQGVCLSPPAASATVATFAEVELHFFSVFVDPLGPPIPFDPARTRLFLEFRQGSPTGIIVGATSVAVQRP